MGSKKKRHDDFWTILMLFLCSATLMIVRCSGNTFQKIQDSPCESHFVTSRISLAFCQSPIASCPVAFELFPPVPGICQPKPILDSPLVFGTYLIL